jgi:hypothetical protein
VDTKGNFILKVDAEYSGIYFALIIFLCLSIYIIIKVPAENIDTAIYIVAGGGLLGYIWIQSVTVCFEINSNTFILNFPLRPFYKSVAFNTKSITWIYLSDQNFGRNPPSIDIYYTDENGKEKKKGFNWYADRKEIQQMINVLREMNINVKVKSRQMN